MLIGGGLPRRWWKTASTRSTHITEARINDRIRVPEVRLVGPNGEQVGIVRVEDALRLAQEADLDLVEVAPDARPPVCKLMDFGKFKYEADMKAREARRNQTNTVLKEIRFRLKIDPHDYGTKKGHVERFLKAGDKVKVMIMFRGREQSRPEMGIRLLTRLADDVAELGFVESSPKQDGRNMIMVLGPTKKKADQKQEQRRAAKGAETAREAQAPREAPAPASPVQAAPAAAPAVAPAEVVAAAVAAPAVPVAKTPAPAAKPVAAKPVAAKPVETKPAETKPVATKPAETKPVATKPAETKPVATKPAETKPAEAKPVASKPAESKPVATKSAESKPVTTPKPVAAPKPVATPRPTAVPRPTPTPRPAPKPAAAKPSAAKPAASKPSASKPAAPQPPAAGGSA